MDNRIYRRFFRIWAVTVVASIIAVAGFNLVIDPYDLYGVMSIKGFNSVKPVARLHSRMVKSFLVRKLKPGVIILGTSRAGTGINPDHPVFSDRSISASLVPYNLAFPDSTPREMLLYLKFAHRLKPLKEVVVGLDFFAFNAYRKDVGEGFDENRLETGNVFSGYGPVLLPTLLSYDAFSDSLETITGQADNRNGVILPNGQSVRDRAIIKKKGGYGKAFRVVRENYMKTMWFPLPEKKYSLTIKNKKNSSPIGELRAMVEFARRENIRLHLFISPLHAYLQEGVASVGLWDEFEQWKRELALAVMTAGPAGYKNSVALWDFSGYNSITTEVIPSVGDVHSQMKWYWDAAHYSSAAGELVLDRMYGRTVPGRALPGDFGVMIGTDNIEEHLKKIRQDRLEYGKMHPGDLPENLPKALKAIAELKNIAKSKQTGKNN